MSYTQQFRELGPNTTTTTVIAEETTTNGGMTMHDRLLHEQRMHQGMGLGWFGHLILWLFIFFVFWWLIFFSCKVWFVLGADGLVDTARVAGWAAVAALLTLAIVWVIVWLVRRSKRC